MDWKTFCDRLTNSIWTSIKPIIGTREAAARIPKYKKNTKRIDALAEDLAIDYLKKEKMDIRLLSEEIGELLIGSRPKYTMVLDPIDGTTNAVKGLPFFSTSIAIAKGDKFEDLVFGYVKNYLANEVFYVNQNGSFYNGKKANSSSCTSTYKALVSLYSYSQVNYDQIKRILRKIGKMRLFGAVSIELVYVGSNLLDGLIDLRGGLLVTDIAAGILFIKRAGGLVTTVEGVNFNGKLDMNERYSILATGSSKLHQKFLKIINTVQ